MSNRLRKTGFTMIELLISVAILATLAAIAAPRFIRARYSAYIAACMSNERNLATAMEAYRVGYLVYPSSLDLLVHDGHLKKVPECPSAPGTGQYDYETSSDFKNYTVSCNNGVHAQQVPTAVHGYPQYVNGAGVLERP